MSNPGEKLQVSEQAKRVAIRDAALRVEGHGLEVLFRAAIELTHAPNCRAEAITAAELGHRASVFAGRIRARAGLHERTFTCGMCRKTLPAWLIEEHVKKEHRLEMAERPASDFL